jgi:hypothetical protein
METTLIQRAKFDIRDYKTGIDSIVRFDYMGNTEAIEATIILAEQNNKRIIVVGGNGLNNIDKLKSLVSENDVVINETITNPNFDKLESLIGYVEDIQYSHLSKKELEANIEPVRTEPKYNRNDQCPCGSGKKYKKCCLINKK